MGASQHCGNAIPGGVDGGARAPAFRVDRGRVAGGVAKEGQHRLQGFGCQGSGGGVVEVDAAHARLLRVAAMTASVNSSVNAWPPRSAVRMPARTVSNTAE